MKPPQQMRDEASDAALHLRMLDAMDVSSGPTTIVHVARGNVLRPAFDALTASTGRYPTLAALFTWTMEHGTEDHRQRLERAFAETSR